MTTPSTIVENPETIVVAPEVTETSALLKNQRPPGNDDDLELRGVGEGGQPGRVAQGLYSCLPLTWRIIGIASTVFCFIGTVYQLSEEIDKEEHPFDGPLSVFCTGAGLLAIVYLSTLAKSASKKLEEGAKWMKPAAQIALLVTGVGVGTTCSLVASRNAQHYVNVHPFNSSLVPLNSTMSTNSTVPRGLEQNLATLGRTTAFASILVIAGLPRQIQWIPINLSALSSPVLATFFGGIILPNGGWPDPTLSTKIEPILSPDTQATSYFFLSTLSVYILAMYAFAASNQRTRPITTPSIDNSETRLRYLETTLRTLIVESENRLPSLNRRTLTLFLAGEQLPKAVLGSAALVLGAMLTNEVWNDTFDMAGALLLGSFVLSSIGVLGLGLKQYLEIKYPTTVEYDEVEEEPKSRVDLRVKMTNIALLVGQFFGPVLAGYLTTIRAPKQWSMVRHPLAIGVVGGLMTFGKLIAIYQDSQETEIRHQTFTKVDHIVASFFLATYISAWISGTVQSGVPENVRNMVWTHLTALLIFYTLTSLMGNAYRAKPHRRLGNQIRLSSCATPWIPLAGYIAVRAVGKGHLTETKPSVPSYIAWACLGAAMGGEMGETASEHRLPAQGGEPGNLTIVQKVIAYFKSEHGLKLIPITALYLNAYIYFGIIVPGDVRQ